MSKYLTASDLTQFTGSTVWYRHWCVQSIFYTAGVQYVAGKADTYWLIGEIALAQLNPTQPEAYGISAVDPAGRRRQRRASRVRRW